MLADGTLKLRLYDDTSLAIDITRFTSSNSYMWFCNSSAGTDCLKMSAGTLAIGLAESVTYQFTTSGLFPQTNASKDLGIDAQAWRRLRLAGTAPVTGDFVLSSTWGSVATTTAITGSDSHVNFTITASVTGIGANPTITYTFKNGTWTTAPFCYVQIDATSDAASALATAITNTTTATTVVITYNGLPVATKTYTFQTLCIGQ
jgi:hypothetical protein